MKWVTTSFQEWWIGKKKTKKPVHQEQITSFSENRPSMAGKSTIWTINPICEWMKHSGNVRYQARHNSGRAKREDQVISVRALTLWSKE
jgi:hypothetical protein